MPRRSSPPSSAAGRHAITDAPRSDRRAPLSDAEALECGICRRASIVGGLPRLPEGVGRGATIPALLVEPADGEEQVDVPRSEELAAILDVRAIAVERAIVEVLAAVEGARLGEGREGGGRVGRGGGGGQALLECRDVRPRDDRWVESVSIVRERDGLRALP